MYRVLEARAWGCWGAVGPSLASLKGVESCLESLATVPRAGWQEPMASPGQMKPQARPML